MLVSTVVECLHRFSNRELLDNHVFNCIKHAPTSIEMPEVKEFSFTNYEMTEKIPRYIVADFESILAPISGVEQNPEKSSTYKLNQHMSCGFAYVVISQDGSTKPFVYR